MFGIGLPELIVIFALALIVVGPHRLPELARAVGNGMKELQRAVQGMRDEMDFETQRSEPLIPPEDSHPSEARSDPTTREGN